MFRTVVTMALKGSHRLIMGKMLSDCNWSHLSLSAKMPIFKLVRDIALSVLIVTSLNLRVSRAGMKSRTSSNCGHIVYFVLELLVLER